MRAGSDTITGADDVISANAGVGRRRIRFVADGAPVGSRVGDALGFAIAFEDESGLQGDLRVRGQIAEVPYHGGEHVAAGDEVGREVDGLVAPVEEITARRAPGGAMAVDEELVPVVAADVDDEAFGPGGDVERAAEAADGVVGGGRAGGGNPARAPRAPQQRLPTQQWGCARGEQEAAARE